MLAKRSNSRRAGVLAALATLVVTGALAGPASALDTYKQRNIVSNVPGLARVTDPNLTNAWGITAGPTTPVWVNTNGSGLSELWAGAVNGQDPFSPFAVSIPGGAPTGIVFNGGDEFSMTDSQGTGTARFIFDSEAGTISAWRLTNPLILTATQVASSPTAIYKGLAIGPSSMGRLLYATDFHNARIDTYDSSFSPVSLPAGAFTDPMIPSGYAPFNIQRLGSFLYVTYAKQDADAEDDVHCPGCGFVDKYGFNGGLVARVARGGTLNAPWGLAIAPRGFGHRGQLLVGNFGDGRINVFDPGAGKFRGQLANRQGGPLTIDGLWGLMPSNGVFGKVPSIVFSAGPNGEHDGLLGILQRS